MVNFNFNAVQTVLGDGLDACRSAQNLAGTSAFFSFSLSMLPPVMLHPVTLHPLDYHVLATPDLYLSP